MEPDKFQNELWMGDDNAGVMCRFKGGNYRRPLENVYYPFGPLVKPDSWDCTGHGTIDVTGKTGIVLLRAHTGPTTLVAGHLLHFKIDLYITPFKPIDTDRHWADRYIHPHAGAGEKVVNKVLTELQPAGPNIVEIHHATYLNPYINYPFNSDSFGVLQQFVKKVHDLHVRLLVYYTTRELTINLPELWALHSLGGEIIFPGPGAAARPITNRKGPHPWLIKHLVRNFIPAWRAIIGAPYHKLDLAVITTPDSRWNNFYLAGLNYLCTRGDIDGIYVDGTALGGHDMQRARRILDTHPGRLIDLHVWNHSNRSGHSGSSSIIYMVIMPYLDRLWVGEGYDANKVNPDYWLIEMSGIPYGQMADMLQGGGNPWLGMMYGETAKLGWSKAKPQPMWKFWDTFGIKGSEMIGYWDPACPVRTNSPDVLATVYRKPHKMLIAIGNFSKQPQTVQLTFNPSILKNGHAATKLTAPAIKGFQSAQTFSPHQEITLEGKRGLLLVLTE